MESEKQKLYDQLGKKLIVTLEGNKAVVISLFKKQHGIKKKRRKKIFRSRLAEMNPEIPLVQHGRC